MIIVAGPCQIESVAHVLSMAEAVAAVSARLGLPIVFKASFDKANRTDGNSPRGAGMDALITAFASIRARFGLETLTDVHEPWQVDRVAGVCTHLQIPALLCRQTDLIQTVARSGRAVNIKKGQGVAPQDMRFAVAKAFDSGADSVWVTERGTSFGHQDLVVDMRGLPVLKASGADAVLFDATHSVQRPGSLGGATGGDRALMPVLARAAIAAGVDGIFVETHDDPDNAPSDGPVMWPVAGLYEFLAPLRDLHAFGKGRQA